MCEPASFVVVKGPKALWSKRSDAHTEIRTDHGVPENGIGHPSSVQVEITPAGRNYALPLKDWTFRFDQTELPEWWDAVEAEKECRSELENWAKARLFVNRNGEVRDGCVFACGSSTVTAYGSSTVTAYDSSTVTAYDSSTVTAYGSSTVTAYDSSKVTACEGSATVSVYCAFSCKLTGALAVIINRIGKKAKCYVGTEKTQIVVGK